MQTQATPVISRRHAFKWMSATSAAALLLNSDSAPAQQAAEDKALAPIQGAGFYRSMIGDFEVTLISDGAFPFGQVHQTFGLNADKAAVERALADAFIPVDKAYGQVNALVIKGGGATILVDAGVGQLMGPVTGFVRQNLARAGYRPEDVTHVLFTHLHPDHAGGALDANGAAVFPKAAYLLHKAEQTFWTAEKPDFSKSAAPEEMQQTVTGVARKALEALKPKTTLLDGARADVVPGVSIVLTPGHTPGHVTVEINSQGQRMTHIADLAHHYAISFPHPEWHVAFDTDRDQAVATRKQAYAALAENRTLISGSHLPFPGFGHLRKVANDSYAYAPVPWMW